jgi:carbamoyl-phosphate synthase large subunit
MTEKISVLVTGVGGGGHGHEIVKALRLAERYHIVGVDMNKTSLGLFDVDEAYTVPSAAHTDYLPTIMDICQQKNVKVLFHGSEPELKVFSREREQIVAAGILLPINTADIIGIGMDKWRTMTYLREHGFDTPLTMLVASEQEIPSEFPLPAVIKPAVGGGGSNNVYLVQELEELRFACRLLVRQGLKVVLQEYVGTPDDEYTVGVLHTLDGELVGSIALRRHILSGLSNRIKAPNRTGREELSSVLAISSGVSQGEIGEFLEVRQQCEKIATMLGSRGPLNIQCRYVGNTLYPFEINPRFSGTTYIRALMGFNEPDLMVRHHLSGEAISRPVSYRFGHVVRGLREHRVDQTSELSVSYWHLG